ncbi:MAG: methyltransferase [Thermomicrobiales bacterium]
MADAPETFAGDNPAAELLRLIRGGWIAQAISVAARLGLADLLTDGPRSCAELGVATGLPENSVRRLLRALASVGVFAGVDGDRFEMTPLAESLRSEAPGSLRATAIATGEIFIPAWGSLLPSLRSGQPEFAQRFGAEFFPYLAANPELGAWFQEGMTNLNAGTSAALPKAYDFSGVSCLVDVGGGNGSLLAAVLRDVPGIRGVLFDLPHVLAGARRNLTEAGVIDRCDIVGGSFFEGVPAGADVYALRWILHDFDDGRAARILRACRTAMEPDGRLLVLEQVMAEKDEPAAWSTAFFDLHMLSFSADGNGP